MDRFPIACHITFLGWSRWIHKFFKKNPAGSIFVAYPVPRVDSKLTFCSAKLSRLIFEFWRFSPQKTAAKLFISRIARFFFFGIHMDFCHIQDQVPTIPLLEVKVPRGLRRVGGCLEVKPTSKNSHQQVWMIKITLLKNILGP